MIESCRVVITTEQYQEYLRLKEKDDHWHKEAERISHEAIGARLEVVTLKKKLDIATNALSNIEDGYSEVTGAGQTARQALKEIKEV